LEIVTSLSVLIKHNNYKYKVIFKVYARYATEEETIKLSKI